MAASDAYGFIGMATTIVGVVGISFAGLLTQLWVPGWVHRNAVAELKREQGERLAEKDRIIADKDAEIKLFRTGMFRTLETAHGVGRVAEALSPPGRKARRDGME